jgi:hypothetical protein
MATIEEWKELLRELPDNVQKDKYYEKEFLTIMNGVLAREGESWVRAHKTMLLSQWTYISTLV